MDKKLSEELEELFTMETKRATFISIDEMELVKKAKSLEKKLEVSEGVVLVNRSVIIDLKAELQKLKEIPNIYRKHGYMPPDRMAEKALHKEIDELLNQKTNG